jgi:hypothetical protein
VLKNAGSVEVIGRENIFLNHPRNPNLSTRNALKRAQNLLGTSEADIRIFTTLTKIGSRKQYQDRKRNRTRPLDNKRGSSQQ